MTNARSLRSTIRDGLIVIVLGGLAIYLGSFLYLSRVAMGKAEEFGMEDYYFTEPAWTTEREHTGQLLCNLYWPLIEIDAYLVSGIRPRVVQPVRLIDQIQAAPQNAPGPIR